MDDGFGEEMRLTKRKRGMGRRKRRTRAEMKKVFFSAGLKCGLEQGDEEDKFSYIWEEQMGWREGEKTEMKMFKERMMTW